MLKFGLIKEGILTNLESKYSEDKKVFNEELSKFVKIISKSPVITEMFRVYNNILSEHFDEMEYANQYLDETLNYLQTLNLSKKDIALLESIERKQLTDNEIDPHIKALDTLVFSDKRNIKERVDAKYLLLKKLVTESKSSNNLDPVFGNVFLDLLKKKLNNKLGKLNESEVKALNAFMINDEEELLSNYIKIIEENIEAVNNHLKDNNDKDQITKLNQAKDNLLEMKNEKPDLESLERLFVLKEAFNK